MNAYNWKGEAEVWGKGKARGKTRQLSTGNSGRDCPEESERDRVNRGSRLKKRKSRPAGVAQWVRVDL